MTEIDRPMKLFRMAYMSRNDIVGDEQQIMREIAQILLASRRNNPAKGVTGALIYSADCFIQALEGSEVAVQSVFDMIEGDPRHCEITMLESHPIAERSFPAWSMAYSGNEGRFKSRFDEMMRLGAGAPLNRVASELLEQLSSELGTGAA